MALPSLLGTLLAVIPLLPLLCIAHLFLIVRLLGWSLQQNSKSRRETILLQTRIDLKALEDKHTEDGWEKIEKTGTAPNGQAPPVDGDWDGLVGFFHPFCNAGGGGERVLWAAIAATQKRWPNAVCAVYTGDHDIDRASAIAKVKERFGITLREPTLHFIYLSTRHFVLASTYPHFTLLGQSLGSLVLAYDAFHLLVPDIFIDTMGYAFALTFCKYLFPSVPTAAYVHYPTISTDMLDSLDDTTGKRGIHSGGGAGASGRAKKLYWRLFAWLYGWVGRRIDVVMCNSSWTRGHIVQLWGRRRNRNSPSFAQVLYPPCPVEELESKIDVNPASEALRQNIILFIAQFRPEKNHSLVLHAFAKYYHSKPQSTARLVLIGSVRSNTPDERHVYNLRLLARELKIDSPATTFICDAPFGLITQYLQKASITVNAMYSEHFGIGNVEGLAAGLIPVVHDSGGPKMDIVVPWEGHQIGWRAEDEAGFAAAFQAVADMDPTERLEMRKRGRSSVWRFSEEAFATKWVSIMEQLVGMTNSTGSGSRSKTKNKKEK